MMALAVGLSLVTILLVGAAPGRAATTGTTYDEVQVMIHTTNSTFVGTYTVTAYNSTGYALVTYETPYPAASFELPSASYIFTVSAASEYPYACPLATGTESTGTVSTEQSGGSGGPAVIVLPCYPGYQDTEYGYAVQQVSGPTLITISTLPVAKYPTTTIAVHVNFVNGTAAVGANVYSSVLGGQWYAPPEAAGVNMSGTVGTDGIAKLIVPAAPLEVTAWDWVPVSTPVSHSTVQVSIGGQVVNVTVNWEPSYVGLAGSVLIVPPQTSGTITLRLQQTDYWVTPAGGETPNTVSTGTSATPATASSGPDLIPASVSSAQATGQSSGGATTVTSTVSELIQTPSSTSPKSSSGSPGYPTELLTVVGALALGLATASLIIVRRRPEA